MAPMMDPVDLGDTRVDTAWWTSSRCPDQYEGRLHDGRWFYFRYRWGLAYVGIGATLGDAIGDEHDQQAYGGYLDGEWPDTATRNRAFTRLLTAALARRHPP